MPSRKSFFYVGVTVMALLATGAYAQTAVKSIGEPDAAATSVTTTPSVTTPVATNAVTNPGTTITTNTTATAPVTQIVNGKVVTPLTTTTAINPNGNTPAAASQPTIAQTSAKTTTIQQIQPQTTTATLTQSVGTAKTTTQQAAATTTKTVTAAEALATEKAVLSTMNHSMYKEKLKERKARQMALLGPQHTSRLHQSIIKTEIIAQTGIVADKLAAVSKTNTPAPTQ